MIALTALCAAAAWFAVFLIAEILASRWRGGGAKWLLCDLVGCGTGFVLTVSAMAPALGGWSGIVLGTAFGGLTYACLFVLYAPFLYTIRNSLSVQSLMLLRRRGGRLPEAELFRRFGSRPIVAERLATLEQSGYLARMNGRYRLTPCGRAIARPFAALKAFWRLGPGG